MVNRNADYRKINWLQSLATSVQINYLKINHLFYSIKGMLIENLL
ncbi:hypothetical protein [Neobacillus jeddahensis]|nr:hypothetical protein [Neobacillus jeddahensis]